jgi:hypothetical protein
MKRREFFEKAGIGSAALALPALATVPNGKGSGGKQPEQEEHGHGKQDDMEGPLSSATVSFGQWDLTTPLDRFPNVSDRNRNNHKLIPGTVDIKAGGSVNFIISGFHHILIYDDGTKPSDIHYTMTVPTTVQPGPPLINDPVKRIYRGLDPSVMPQLPGGVGAIPPTMPLQDRVEVVRFPNPGKFLVICGVQPHFVDIATGEFIMFGYVKVKK